MVQTAVAPTSADAPYDALAGHRPMRCRKVTSWTPTVRCNRTIRLIDWSREDVYDERCPKCGAWNVLYVSPTVSPRVPADDA